MPRLRRRHLRRRYTVDVWTVDKAVGMQRLFDQGGPGIVTNYPDVALRLRAASMLPEALPLSATPPLRK